MRFFTKCKLHIYIYFNLLNPGYKSVMNYFVAELLHRYFSVFQ